MGQSYGDFLHYIGGKTPKEFGALNYDERAFLMAWYNKKVEKWNKEANK